MKIKKEDNMILETIENQYIVTGDIKAIGFDVAEGDDFAISVPIIYKNGKWHLEPLDSQRV